jgi:hypothetical protein
VYTRSRRQERGNPPAWNDITELAGYVRAFDNITDVAYIAEANLLDELHYIDRDRHNQNVRLTTTSRENCGRGIQIPDQLTHCKSISISL